LRQLPDNLSHVFWSLEIAAEWKAATKAITPKKLLCSNWICFGMSKFEVGLEGLEILKGRRHLSNLDHFG